MSVLWYVVAEIEGVFVDIDKILMYECYMFCFVFKEKEKTESYTRKIFGSVRCV